MIKNIKRKLIIISIASLFSVLFIIMSVIGTVNYQKIVKNADEIIYIISENGGSFPGHMDMKEKNEEKGLPGEKNISVRGLDISPEMPYETRYFTVVIGDDGEISTVNTGKIAAVDTSAAAEYADRAVKSGKNEGFEDKYRYNIRNTSDGKQVVFLDCRRDIDTFISFIITGVMVSVIGIAAVLVMVILLSNRIVKPFSENYEKQKRFITDAGHELKTPLTIIDADTEVVKMDIGENEWLNDIQNQTKRLADITEKLIILSKMEEDNNDNIKIEFLLSDLIEEETAAFKALARTQNKELSTDIEKMVAFYGDEKTFRRLIDILLDNAVKYSEKNGKINVSLAKHKNFIIIEVTNTTEYISRKNTDKLFDRFYRTDESRNSKTGGYGLGLSIAAAITTSYKGRITAETKDEKSLKITVKLPLAKTVR